MALSPLGQLLENIATNLADDTNYPNLAELYNTVLTDASDAIQATFVPRPWDPPYATVQPGAATKMGEQGRFDEQDVEVVLVHGIMDDQGHTGTLVGNALLNGSLYLLDEIEAALVPADRIHAPYTGATFGAGAYVSQDAVRSGYATAWSAPEQVVDPTGAAQWLVTQTLTLRYLVAKGT